MYKSYKKPLSHKIHLRFVSNTTKLCLDGTYVFTMVVLVFRFAHKLHFDHAFQWRLHCKYAYKRRDATTKKYPWRWCKAATWGENWIRWTVLGQSADMYSDRDCSSFRSHTHTHTHTHILLYIYIYIYIYMVLIREEVLQLGWVEKFEPSACRVLIQQIRIWNICQRQ